MLIAGPKIVAKFAPKFALVRKFLADRP